MKRPVLLLIAVLMLGPQNVGMASAQEYPTRQITLIAPWPAGGAIDTLCRLLAPYFADRLGKPMVVENRPGAASVIGTAAGAKSPPDGYTLVWQAADRSRCTAFPSSCNMPGSTRAGFPMLRAAPARPITCRPRCSRA